MELLERVRRIRRKVGTAGADIAITARRGLGFTPTHIPSPAPNDGIVRLAQARAGGAFYARREDAKCTANPIEEYAMAQATLKNQQKILADNRAIISNQKKIIKNQDRLAPILANQEKIIRNQGAIIRNQKKILADHARRFREIALRESKARRAS